MAELCQTRPGNLQLRDLGTWRLRLLRLKRLTVVASVWKDAGMLHSYAVTVHVSSVLTLLKPVTCVANPSPRKSTFINSTLHWIRSIYPSHPDFHYLTSYFLSHVPQTYLRKKSTSKNSGPF